MATVRVERRKCTIAGRPQDCPQCLRCEDREAWRSRPEQFAYLAPLRNRWFESSSLHSYRWVNSAAVFAVSVWMRERGARPLIWTGTPVLRETSDIGAEFVSGMPRLARVVEKSPGECDEIGAAARYDRFGPMWVDNHSDRLHGDARHPFDLRGERHLIARHDTLARARLRWDASTSVTFLEHRPICGSGSAPCRVDFVMLRFLLQHLEYLILAILAIAVAGLVLAGVDLFRGR